jgi:hypothetical protein
VICTVCDDEAELLSFVSTPEEGDAAGVSVNVTGDAETPDGRPESVRLTALEKPFVPLTEMEIDCAEFGVTVIEAGLEIEKSG